MARRPLRRFFIIVTVFLISIFLGGTAGMLAGYLRSAPALDEIVFVQDLTSYIYDIRGEQIAALYRENRIPVSYVDIPQHLRDAIVAIEDARFYEHHGFDVRALARAFVADIRRMMGQGGFLQGGSTITQQLAKNAFLTHERTWSRKLQELLWAIQIERKYSKSEILETYLNEIYLGPGIYGVEAASRYYFGKSVSDLTLPEAALIAGLAQNAGLHSPFRDEEAGRRRRNTVLMRMEELGYITKQEGEAARAAPIVLTDVRGVRNLAPDFVNYVVQQLLELPGIDANAIYGGGLHIYTTLDLAMQRQAQAAIEEAFAAPGSVLQRLTERLSPKNGDGLLQPQVALVALEPRTGHIRAMIGGRNNDEFNRAVQARRRPGSAMKPFVYTAAIAAGLGPATVLVDEEMIDETTGEVWPRNFGGTYAGPVTLREALERSINTIAVQLIDQHVTSSQVVSLAQKMGITTLVTQGVNNDMTRSLAIGALTTGVRPIEIAQAYGVLANHGVRTDTLAILRVEGPDGRVLHAFDTKEEVVLSEAVSYVVTDMLRGVILRGTGRRADIGRPAAGKTGTTDREGDLWFVGYTPQLVAAVWIGEDYNTPLELPGASVGSGEAAAIWARFMRAAHADLPVRDFEKPTTGLVENVLVDVRTGLRIEGSCFMVPRDEQRLEIFVAGTEPTETSPRCNNPFWSPSFNSEQETGRLRLDPTTPFRFDFDL